jgi:hypothetical protein
MRLFHAIRKRCSLRLEVPTRKARLHKISRHSSHKISTTLSLEGKVLAIKKDVLDLINSYQGRVALLDRSHIVLVLVGSPWCVRCIRRNSDHAIVIYCEDLDTSARRKP